MARRTRTVAAPGAPSTLPLLSHGSTTQLLPPELWHVVPDWHATPESKVAGSGRRYLETVAGRWQRRPSWGTLHTMARPRTSARAAAASAACHLATACSPMRSAGTSHPGATPVRPQQTSIHPMSPRLSSLSFLEPARATTPTTPSLPPYPPQPPAMSSASGGSVDGSTSIDMEEPAPLRTIDSPFRAGGQGDAHVGSLSTVASVRSMDVSRGWLERGAWQQERAHSLV